MGRQSFAINALNLSTSPCIKTIHEQQKSIYHPTALLFVVFSTLFLPSSQVENPLLDVEGAGRANSAAGARGNRHGDRPGTTGADGVGGAVDAVEGALGAGTGDRGRGDGGDGGDRGDGGDGVLDDRSRGGLGSDGSSGRGDGGRAGSTTGATNGRAKAGVGAELLNVGTGVGVGHVGALDGGTVEAGDVGNEHVGEAVERDGTGAARDLNGGAVHVHLAVADLVEPRPGEVVLASRDVGDLNAVLGQREHVVIGLDVARLRSVRAAALEGLDDLEDGADGRVHVRGDGDLARATAVDDRALELEALGAASLESGRLDASEIGGATRVGSARGAVERGVDDTTLEGVGGRESQENVGGSRRGEASVGESLGEHGERVDGKMRTSLKNRMKE
jgi:hypothetical protein